MALVLDVMAAPILLAIRVLVKHINWVLFSLAAHRAAL